MSSSSTKLVPLQGTQGTQGIANLPRLDNWKNQLATVPGRLKLARLATTVMSAVFIVLSYTNFAELRQTIETVGHDTVPSIVAAEHVRATLADANANAANFFLGSEQDDGPSWVAYQREMDEINKNLLVASQNITFGDEERLPIMTMMTNLSDYTRLIGQARGRRASNGDFRGDLEAADQLMRTTILSAAFALDEANFAHLTSTYDTHRNGFASHAVPTIASALVLLLVLLALQFYLRQKTNRLFNPGVVLATIALAAWSIYAASVLPKAEADLKLAKEDAFDSIHALWQARAVSYDANADESFYLLDHGKADRQADWNSQFNGKASQLVEGDFEQAVHNGFNGGSFKGYLGNELTNVTFKGEKAQALEMLHNWANYMEIDKHIRELESTGHYKEALELNIGTKPGQSNWAFSQFDQSLGKTLDINQHEFDAAIERALHRLDKFVYGLAATLVLIVIATIIGLKARLDEYRF